ncbi:MAG: type II secretion system protein [Colwellia sp.]|nr:type II secretion system protein [Colwellia sp.]
MRQNKISHRNKQQGMTLIEVLVASTILFSFLAVMTQVMGTATIASDQAEKNITISLNMPFIIDEIKSEMDAGKTSSNGELHIADVSYTWQAKQIDRLPILHSPLQVQPITRFVMLYNIKLIINFKSLQKVFHYTDVISEK